VANLCLHAIYPQGYRTYVHGSETHSKFVGNLISRVSHLPTPWSEMGDPRNKVGLLAM